MNFEQIIDQIKQVKYVDIECDSEVEGYLISTNGYVRNEKTGKILKSRHSKNIYGRVLLKGQEYYLHRMVAKTYIQNPCPGVYDQVDHKNINRLDNRVQNLRWCDAKMNCNNKSNNIVRVV